MKYFKKFLKTFFKTLFLTLFIGFILITILFFYKYYPILKSYNDEAINIVKESNYNTFKLNQTTYIYDDNNNIICKLNNSTNSEYLEYDEIPDNVKNAFIAIEDRTFWTNNGYDIKGIARVLYNAIKTKGDELHGASTITQQLARLTFLSQEVSLERKVKEILISIELTNKYTKEDILEFYCNDIYFANGYYGINAAARGYFNKNIDELSLAQIAYICSIPNRPTYYDPFVNKDNAINRQQKILNDMFELGYINEKEYKNALNEEIILEKPIIEENNYQSSYAIHCAIEYLMTLNGFEFSNNFKNQEEYNDYTNNYDKQYQIAKDTLYTQGYKIYTSLNKDTQNLLQSSIDETMNFDKEVSNEGIYTLQSSATIIDNNSKKVIAIVGGRSQDNITKYGINRAFQSFRQPGSTMKPIVVYTPALQNGYNSNSQLIDIDVKTANKGNVDINLLTGNPISLRQAVITSKNGCAYYLFNKIGVKYGLSFLHQMKFEKLSYNDNSLSIALGGLTYGASTVEMASAYNSLANEGNYISPTCIVSILDNKGNELYNEPKPIQVYEKDAANLMTSILEDVISRGTAKSMNWNLEMPVAGKTGTTNSNKDGWFCGYSPYYTIAVWVGYDNPKEVDNLYGGTYPCQIWKLTMEELVKDKPIIEFNKPTNTSTGDETYLPGRSDDEILSDGYTVGDYRSDYAIVDEVKNIANKMLETDDYYEIASIYAEASEKIDTIYGRHATQIAQEYLDNIYNSKNSQ